MDTETKEYFPIFYRLRNAEKSSDYDKRQFSHHLRESENSERSFIESRKKFYYSRGETNSVEKIVFNQETEDQKMNYHRTSCKETLHYQGEEEEVVSKQRCPT